MNQYLQLLGLKVRDKVTGFIGTVETISFDLYGCIQAVVRPPIDKKKSAEVPDGRWFDAKRLEVLPGKPVMPVPSFATVAGGAQKPAKPSSPLQ